MAFQPSRGFVLATSGQPPNSTSLFHLQSKRLCSADDNTVADSAIENQLCITGRASKAFPIELSPAGQGPGNTARLRQTLARAPM